MKKLKVALVISVMLNILLITAIVAGRSFVRKQSFELAALTAQSEAKQFEIILQYLESDDPNNMNKLKNYLLENIKMANQSEKIWSNTK